MPLPTPILDDRSYAQLRDELMRRIPVYAPEWTDHNASDPGITLVELFAFLGENLLYRFNQIPEATKLEFLRLLEMRGQAAVPASAVVGLSTKKLAGELVEKGTRFKAGSVEFESEVEVRALPVRLQAVSKEGTDEPPDLDSASEFEQDAAYVYRESVESYFGGKFTSYEDALAAVSPYVAQQLPAPDEGEALDFDRAVDRTLWIAVVAEEFSADEVRAALAEHEDRPLYLNVGFVPGEEAPSAVEVAACAGEGGASGSRPIEWQVSTGDLSGDDPTAPRYGGLRVLLDTTQGLTRPGVVRLELPTDADGMRPFLVDEEFAGIGDLPPVLDEETEASLVCWIRAFRRPSSVGADDEGGLGEVRLVVGNATEVLQSVRAGTEYLGKGTGSAGQELALNHSPVLAGTVVLQVEEPEGWRTWAEVEHFQASGESDRHFVVDHEAGTVRFGNALQGYAPQIGQRIRVQSYRYGGGSVGNVPAGAITKVSGHEGVASANALPASGGGDGESIEDALDRIPGEVRRNDRAVTSGDFRELALLTPGASLSRAECLPRYLLHDAGEAREDAAGVVTVMIWPSADPAHPDAPRPTRDVLRRVCEWLDQKRLVTTELYVIPPTYRRIAVSVGVEVKAGYGVEAVRSWVELVLRQYLAPVPPYGPGGEGWPNGRRVHGPELEAAVLQVEGVEFVHELFVAEESSDGSWPADWSGVPIELMRHEVPELAGITVLDGEVPTLAPGEVVAAPSPDRPAVPIPIVQEEC